VRLKHFAEIRDTASGESLYRPGGNGVDTNSFGPKSDAVANAGFERRFATPITL
jgi:hypothetical protein